MKRFNLKEAKGITLVALVITVIILLILAGVTLNLVVGENGLIAKSKRATEEYRQKAEQERGQLGDFEQGINEYSEDKDVMKILVNSGDDGKVGLPIEANEGNNFTIDWGDGNISNVKGEKIASKKIASKNYPKLALIAPGIMEKNSFHIYTEKNKEYEIKIKGKVKIINAFVSNEEINEWCTATQILKILQWGENGIERLSLAGCSNLSEIAMPFEKSFENIKSFNRGFKDCESLTNIPEQLFKNCPNATDFGFVFFGCTNLTSIPQKLFKNCPNATDFGYAFGECTNLTSIPQNLFENCLKVTSFEYAFEFCTNLQGNSIQLWNESRPGITQNSGGRACYWKCEKLEDYAEIPSYWK